MDKPPDLLTSGPNPQDEKISCNRETKCCLYISPIKSAVLRYRDSSNAGTQKNEDNPSPNISIPMPFNLSWRVFANSKQYMSKIGEKIRLITLWESNTNA